MFIGNNVGNNDTTYKALVRRFRLNKSKDLRRLRCCSYIINLAAKVFIFSKDYKAFKDKVDTAERATVRDQRNLATE